MPGLSKIIRDRHTTREPFDADRPIAKPELKQILDAARWAPTPNNMQNFDILLVDDKLQLEAIGKIPADMSERFLRENYAQLSPSDEELKIKKTGMLASAFPEAWTNPEAWSPDSDYRYQLTFLGRSVQETPLLLVMLYDGSKHAPGETRDFPGTHRPGLCPGEHVADERVVGNWIPCPHCLCRWRSRTEGADRTAYPVPYEGGLRVRSRISEAARGQFHAGTSRYRGFCPPQPVWHEGHCLESDPRLAKSRAYFHL